VYQEKEMTGFVQCLKWENRLEDEKQRLLNNGNCTSEKLSKEGELGPDLPYKYAEERTGGLGK